LIQPVTHRGDCRVLTGATGMKIIAGSPGSGDPQGTAMVTISQPANCSHILFIDIDVEKARHKEL